MRTLYWLAFYQLQPYVVYSPLEDWVLVSTIDYPLDSCSWMGGGGVFQFYLMLFGPPFSL